MSVSSPLVRILEQKNRFWPLRIVINSRHRRFQQSLGLLIR